MNIFSFVSALQAPNDLWSILINWIKGGVGNLGWTILLLTLLVKAVTLPLDLLTKYTQKKQTLVQQKCAPEVAKLQKKFGNDRQRLQMQTNALYKREGLKMGTGCVVMLVNMILTMVIFFTFFASFRDYSAYEAIHQYEQVEAAYTETFYDEMIEKYDELETDKDVEAWIEKYSSEKAYREAVPGSTTQDYAAFVDQHENTINQITKTSTKAAQNKWHEVKADWLWIKNIWVADATTTPFPTYNELLDMAKDGSKEYAEYVEKNINKEAYSRISGIIAKDEVKNNGFYILAILAGVISYLSQFISELHSKFKNKLVNQIVKKSDQQSTMTMKIMKLILPIMMVMFVLTSSASFGIYLLASNLASIAFGEVVSLIVNALTKKQRLAVEESLEKEVQRLAKKGKI